MRRTLVIMAKAPIPGEVKTQLCPPLAAQSAALLHESFIRDAVEKAASVPDAEVVVAYSPRGTVRFFREIAPKADHYLCQRGSCISERISSCFERLADSQRSVVVMGADSPTLPARCLEIAFSLLDTGQADAVFGPTSSGGCYLVGLRSHHHELFGDVVWSGPNVARSSVRKAADMGLRTHPPAGVVRRRPPGRSGPPPRGTPRPHGGQAPLCPPHPRAHAFVRRARPALSPPRSPASRTD